jgi:putative transposase
MLPEAMRLYRENIALKAQLDALHDHVDRIENKRCAKPVSVRAAQVFAYLLTRGDFEFLKYYLSAPRATIERWLTRFRSFWRRSKGGRPRVKVDIETLVVTLKSENPSWGSRRIREELRRMGIRVSEPTIMRILKENGFSPHPLRELSFERVQSSVKDAVWAIDYFAVKTASGAWSQVLIVIDVHTRELLGLRAYDGWDVDSYWTIRAFSRIASVVKRLPLKVVHDHGATFLGQFARQLGVLEIEPEVTPARMPYMNCYCERWIGSIRREMLRHIRVTDVEDLQWWLDEYRAYANRERAHQGLNGRTPDEVARGQPEADLLDIEAIRSRKLVRRMYANGLLLGYSFVANDALVPTKQAA